MNSPRLALSALIVLSMLAIYSCTGSNMVTPPVMGGVPMSLTITDTPPVGVTVLSFEVSVTGAALNPGNVDLLGSRGSVRIEVKRLETEAAFLNTTNVAPGTYTSLNLTFANPELTFKNDTDFQERYGRCAGGLRRRSGLRDQTDRRADVNIYLLVPGDHCRSRYTLSDSAGCEPQRHSQRDAGSRFQPVRGGQRPAVHTETKR